MVNELRAIVVHERDFDDQTGKALRGREIVDALRRAGVSDLIHWRTQVDFSLDMCQAPLVAVVHASNEDGVNLERGRELVDSFVGGVHVSGSRYADLGGTLRAVGVEALVLVSEGVNVCRQLIAEERDGKRLLYADTEQFIHRARLFVAAVRSGAPLPRDWFYRTVDPTDALGALAILCQAHLIAYADPATGEPDLSPGRARDACRAALERMGWFGHRREDDVLRAELWSAEGRKAVRHSIDREGLWGALGEEDLKRVDEHASGAAIRALVSSIRDGIVGVEVVARAYLAITDG